MRGKFALFLHLLVSFGFPIALNLFVPANDGLGFLFLLYAVFNPLYCAGVGYYISRDLKGRWAHLFLLTGLFVLSFILVFRSFEREFLMYSCVYFFISLFTMGLAYFLRIQKKKAKAI